MPQLQDRKNQIVSEEDPEFAITGPFGGVQSELPLTEIESLGFQDSTNILFRKGVAYVRPGFTPLTPLPAPSNETILGIAHFFNSTGALVQCVLTPTRLLQWNGASSTWTNITGPGFTSSTNLFVWDIVGYKLCFSQGLDQIFYWDGLSGSYVKSSVNAPACYALAEIDLHLVAGNTFESGTRFPQRYRWSGAGDPTDWTSFNAGVNDNLNNLGPINGIIKLGQYGYGMHYQGVVQIIPTGVGTAPFYFLPIINASIGEIAQRSMDHFNRDGQEQAAFVALDNVYVFNQSSVVPIGDKPLDGKGRRYGARSRILADVFSGGIQNCYGVVTNSINGQVFNAYWLLIPGVSCWVYNFDEENWTPFTFSKTGVSLGVFNKSGVPRIIDLVGTILAQNWTPLTLTGTVALPGFAIGFSDGTIGYIDFTNYSELAWQIVSAKHTFGDPRHSHTLKKFRLRVIDQGSVTYTITVTNENNFSQTQQITIGNGSGDVLSSVVEFKINGLRLQWKVSGPPNSPGAIVEFAPIYSVAQEQRGGPSNNG